MKFVIANWKMNGNPKLAQEMLEKLGEKWHGHKSAHKIVIAPPFPLIAHLKNDIGLEIAAQDCHEQDKGAFTGNVSAPLLKELGCKFVILGHSERRQYHGETNALIQSKALTALGNHLTPIICIGESLEDYEAKTTQNVLETQLHEIFESFIPENHILIAYEPLWAIGTGKTPTLDEIHETLAFIHNETKKIGLNASILYGGSVNDQNAADILNLKTAHGVLVGGASLKPLSIQTICDAAYTAPSC